MKYTRSYTVILKHRNTVAVPPIGNKIHRRRRIGLSRLCRSSKWGRGAGAGRLDKILRSSSSQNSRKIRIVSGSDSPAKTSRNTHTRVPKPFVFSVNNEILPPQTMRILADSRRGLCLQALSRQRLSVYYIAHKYVIIELV